MAGGMEAEDHLGARGTFDAKALGANGNATVGADLDGGTNAPNIGPPRAARGGPEDGSFFFAGRVPGLLRGQAQFAMDFVGVAMEAQSVDVGVGGFDIGDVFAGEIGWEAALPELVFALDFSFGLGCGGIKEANVIELERPAQLGEGLGILGEEHGVIIDVDLERPAVEEEGGGEEIEVGEEQFPVIEFGADEQAAAIVQHIDHGKVQGAFREPAMRRSIHLPEFADLGALPAAHRGERALGRGGMGITLLDGPMADLGAVELERVQPEGFGGGEAVRARRGTTQPFYEELDDGFGPGGGVVAARGARGPPLFFLGGAGAEVVGAEGVETAARQAQLLGGGGGRQGLLAEGSEDVTDKSRGVTMG